MFRVADMQKRTVVSPTLRAYLYVWGEGRMTYEQEFMPAVVQVGYPCMDGPAHG